MHRIRITNADDGKPVPNDKSTTVASTGLQNGSTIQVKDLGIAETGNDEALIPEYADTTQVRKSPGEPSS